MGSVSVFMLFQVNLFANKVVTEDFAKHIVLLKHLSGEKELDIFHNTNNQNQIKLFQTNLIDELYKATFFYILYFFGWVKYLWISQMHGSIIRTIVIFW